MPPLSDTAMDTATVFSRELGNRKYGIANTLYSLTVISRHISEWALEVREYCTHTTSLLRSKKYSKHTHTHTHTHTYIYIYISSWRYNPLWVCILQPSSLLAYEVS